MSIVDREKFLQCVSKCGIFTKDAYEEWLATVKEDADPKMLARDLMGKKNATRWQARMLLKGANRLSLGNYILTDRIGKTDFGDRFTAVHRQLSRDVAIQYLPADISKSEQSKKKVFAFGSKLAELDHANLIHVYDIDEERGRIYLVSESTKGVELSELRKSPLSANAVAQIVAGCLRGLKYAHARGVVHGNLTDETVVVNENGTPQVRGLTRFALRNALSQSPAQASDDMKSISAMGESLLDAIGSEDRQGPAFASLASAVSVINQDAAEGLEQLDVWLKANGDASHQSADMTLVPAELRARATSHPAMAVAGSSTSQASTSSPVEFEEASADGWLTSLARKNPIALIASTAVTSLLLIGGTVFAATQITSSGSLGNGSVAQLDPEKDSKASGKSRGGKVPPANVQRLDFRDLKGSLSDSAAAAVPADSVTDPNVNKAAIAALFNTSKPDENVEAAAGDAESKIEVVRNDAAPEPATPEPESVAVADDQPAVVETEVAKEVAKQEPQKTEVSAEQKEQETLKAGLDPFADFARTVDLPDLNSTQPVSFGKLILERKHLLGAEILSTPTVHRSKPIFTLNRSADDRQSWDIGFQKRKKSDPVIIAKLQKKPNELLFNWLPAAEEITIANYLRNCRVKLSTASHSHWLTLRKPMKIDGFQLGTNDGTTKVEFEIPWMPNPVAIAAQAGGLKFERLVKDNWKERPYLEPSEITPNAPARMFFHDDADRFLSLDIIADIRKKLVLQAALVMVPIPGQPGVVLEDPAMMPQASARLRQMAMEAELKNTQAQASSLKSDEKKVYKNAATAMADRAELTPFYEHVVPQLVNKDIPVTVTYSLNEQHRIVLAYTVETEDTKEK